ncbi:MAG TPA: amidoligase family protein [Methanosarcina sp.]|nr:amidoligase family protein [Methanosarcina sp.]
MPDNNRPNLEALRAELNARINTTGVMPNQWFGPAPVNTNPEVAIVARDTLQDTAEIARQVRRTPPKSSGSIREQYGLRIPEGIDKILKQHFGEVVMGVELEVENFPQDIPAVAKGIDFTNDGSLRNNGIEAVTRPNTRPGTLNVVKEFWTKFKIENGKNFSDRTSIHVHANVTHFNANQIQNLVFLYCLFEDILFDVVGEDRRDNIFCVPWSQTGLHMGNYHRIWTSAAGWQKYTALNLRPVASQGTVEFRHMYGHADFELLSSWLLIIEEIMQAAETMDNEELYKRVLNMNTSSEYGDFLAQVFPQSATFLTARSPDWRSHMIRGVIEAKLSSVNL